MVGLVDLALVDDDEAVLDALLHYLTRPERQDLVLQRCEEFFNGL